MTEIFGINLVAMLIVIAFIAVVVYIGQELLPKLGEDDDENPDDPPWWSGL